MKGRPEPSIPICDGGILKSWEPWKYAGASINLVAANKFAGDDPFWPVYYSAGISLLDTVRDTLRKVDKENHSRSLNVFIGFENWLKQRRGGINRPRGLPDIFWDFIYCERNNQLHEFASKTRVHATTTRPFLWDGDKMTIQSGTSLTFDDDYDTLQLLAVGFTWVEEKLRIIDQAVFEELESDPFQDRVTAVELEERSYLRIKSGRLDFNY